jgi:hypothetical protein
MPSPPPRTNRLTVAHLLLWMATTGVVLVSRRAEEPPPADEIGFGSFLHQARSEEERRIVFKQRQQEAWRQWNARYLVNLAFAPVGGIAVAGALLAAWRSVTRRFDFPVQSGHWLLVAIIGLMILAAARSHLQARLSGDEPDLVVTLIATVMLIAIAFFNRERVRWCAAFGLLSTGFATISLSLFIQFLSLSIKPNDLFGLGLFAIALFPIAVLCCAALDLSERDRFDTFHWLGIATLFGCVGHFIVLTFVVRAVR